MITSPSCESYLKIEPYQFLHEKCSFFEDENQLALDTPICYNQHFEDSQPSTMPQQNEGTLITIPKHRCLKCGFQVQLSQRASCDLVPLWNFIINGWRAGGRGNDLDVATVMIYGVALSSSQSYLILRVILKPTSHGFRGPRRLLSLECLEWA